MKIPSSDLLGLTSPPPAKKGRPSKIPEVRRRSMRSPPKFKEKKCLLTPNFCKWEGKDTLHKVSSGAKGFELRNIFENTCNDFVQTALSLCAIW